MPEKESLRRRRPDNPGQRFSRLQVEWEEGEEVIQGIRYFRDHSQSILSPNDSPDIPFRYSANPYRGCLHACAYCYARPTHEYLDMGAGTDFDTRILVKTDAPLLLRKAFRKRSWKKELVAFSGVTDCYQPVEAKLKITRACLEVCVEYGNPVSVITKSALVTRDADLLARLSRAGLCRVAFSIPFPDGEFAQAMEPHAPPPVQRFRAMEKLSAAGVPTGVSLGPVIPGLTDSAIPSLLQRAKDHGASYAFYVMLRLPGSSREVFLERLEKRLPEHAPKVRHFLQEAREGQLNDARFGSRMRGSGPRAALVEQLFSMQCRKLGLATGENQLEVAAGSYRPTASPQLDLFDA